ncbi:uncharacterized protein BXZ73DRAFT_78555 [Epithele typhae]|uniref:uncharacterized protein n=1 Tax=Epithele typhae TaxID=378194 RepID=UPI002007B646|nr:uncharacterized protein BXZ73DRAFT_78555 [Epithele typhae]KAH9927533.1 hypothetical protein BXZ73DRAFT_78555 [Epithele typhae]
MADAEALKLKNEGNELFVKNDFGAAYKKYSAAIKLDPKNAVLHCNRAACAYGLNRSASDASAISRSVRGHNLWHSYEHRQATELDPTYAKAWARLAAAELSLYRHMEAIKAWKRAIAALPNENLTPAQAKQRNGYEKDLAALEAQVAEMKAHPKCLKAWLLIYADAVLEGFTNALIADERIFRIADRNFLEMYNKQVAWEATMTGAWTAFGAQRVMEEVTKRLKEEGWSKVKPALAVTVRGWIFRAFMADGLEGNPAASLDIYTSALEVLKWGAEKYKDVPLEERGTVLEPTFIRGVKAMRLNQYMKLANRTNTVTKHSVPLDELIAGADELIKELRDGEPLGFWYAFERYPKALAYSLRGYAYNRQAMKLREEVNELTAEAARLFYEASEEYMKSTLLYPQDDTHHVWFLHCAFEAQQNAEAPVRVLISTLDKLDESIPLAEKIWENSADWPQIKPRLKETMNMRKQLKSAVESGGMNPESSVKIEPIPK